MLLPRIYTGYLHVLHHWTIRLLYGYIIQLIYSLIVAKQELVSVSVQACLYFGFLNEEV